MARAVDVLRQVAPEASPSYLAAFDRGDSLLRQHQITTPDRRVHYLAQRRVCCTTGSGRAGGEPRPRS